MLVTVYQMKDWIIASSSRLFKLMSVNDKFQKINPRTDKQISWFLD